MKKNYQHAIDFLFPIALFFVFSASAVVALLLAANIYQGIVSDSAIQFEQSTALSYLTTKIHQNDTGGDSQIYLTTFDGYDALAIEQTFEDTSFITYIYERDGELKELFLQKGAAVSSKSGTTLMKIEGLTMEAFDNGLFHFTCTSEDGQSDSVMVSLQSQSI